MTYQILYLLGVIRTTVVELVRIADIPTVDQAVKLLFFHPLHHIICYLY